MDNLIRVHDRIINLNFIEFATRKDGVIIYKPNVGEQYLADFYMQQRYPDQCHTGSVTTLWMNGTPEGENYHFYDEEGELIWKYLYDNSINILS